MRARRETTLLIFCGLVLRGLLEPHFPALRAQSSREVHAVGRRELLEAMRGRGAYDPAATSNGARFQAEVLLWLARRSRERDPQAPPLLVDYEDWFRAFLEATGLRAETAPLYARLAHAHGQRLLIDCRAGHVIRALREGPRPGLAANVVIWWPRTPGGPRRYSYRDTLSTPPLKVTNQRLITYRLLDFGDRVVYDEIEGLGGRPTSGMLGLLFRFIGEGRVVQSRMAISPDGLQVSRTRAKKAFWSLTTTVTIHPDGRMQKGVPAERPDLLALERRLKEPLKIEYAPLEVPPWVGN